MQASLNVPQPVGQLHNVATRWNYGNKQLRVRYNSDLILQVEMTTEERKQLLHDAEDLLDGFEPDKLVLNNSSVRLHYTHDGGYALTMSSADSRATTVMNEQQLVHLMQIL